MHRFFKTLVAVALLFKGSLASAQATISAPDGLFYEVRSSRLITKTSAGHCGFNDLSLPNLAKFRLENRKYERFSQGKLLETFYKEVEVFVECIQI